MADFLNWFPGFCRMVWTMVTSYWILAYGFIIAILKWIVDIYKSSRSQ